MIAISCSSLQHGNNRYGSPQSRNSLNYRGAPQHQNRYSAPQHLSAPRAPSVPHAPSSPHSPRRPHSPRVPVSQPQSYGSRNVGYGGNAHNSGPGSYGGGRHFGAAGPSLNQYSGPVSYGSSVPYSGHTGQLHGSGGSNHYSSAKRSVYQQPQEHQSYSSSSRSGGYAPQQNYAQASQQAQSSSTSHGREMKYTVRDPKNRGTTHVTETHVVSNKQMHGAEAEAAMKQLMGSMGPGGSNGGFDDIFKNMGLPFY